MADVNDQSPPPEVDDYLADQDPQSAVAAKGFSQIGSAIAQSQPVQNVVTGQGLRSYDDMLNSAIAGDKDARMELAQRSLGTAMAGVSSEGSPKMVPKGTFKNKFNVDAYHGTKADIEAFDPNTLGASTNAQSAKKAFFFAQDPSTASDYADLSPGRATLRAKAIEDQSWAPVEDASKALKEKYGDNWKDPKEYDSLLDTYQPHELNFTRVEDNDPLLQKYKDARASAEEATNHLYIDPEQKIRSLELQKASIGSGPRPPDIAALQKQKQYWQDQLEKVQSGTASGFSHPPEKIQSFIDKTDAAMKDTSYPDQLKAHKQQIREIDDEIAKQKGYIASDKTGQNVLPVKLRMENPYIHDFKDTGYRDESYSDIIDKAKAAGHDSVVFKNTYDPADRDNRVLQDIYAVFEPHQIRSKFAEFNPKKSKSGNISYSQGGKVAMADGGDIQPITQDAPPEVDQFLADQSGQPQGVDDFIQDQYSTPSQQLKAGLEGVAQGVAGPLAPGAERLVGVDPEAIRARSEANPITHGLGEAAGLVGSMFIPLGQGSLVAKAASKIPEIAEAVRGSQIANAAIRGAAETAMLQTGDEVSKMILSDPNQSAQTAIASVGLSGVLGGVAGGAIGAISPLWKATAGDKLSQTVADFKGRLNEHLQTPDPVAAMTDELGTHYNNMKDMADEVYGAKGLKAQDIAKAMPEMNVKISTQAADITSKVSDLVNEMNAKPSVYPPRLASKLQSDLTTYGSIVGNVNSSAADVFNATQDLKQTVQGYSKFDKFVKPVDEAYDFVKKSKDLAFDLRNSLEDSNVWGPAADRQKAINKAFVTYKPALEDFEKRFTTKVADIENGGFNQVVDPGKVQTYLNQVGKASGEVKQTQLGNFLDASSKYQDVINKTHANLGIDSPIEPSSLAFTKSTLGEKTPGARLADAFIQKGLVGAGGKAVGAGIGAAMGHLVGHGALGAYLGEKTLGPLFESIMPTIAKPMLQYAAKGEAMKAAVDYGMAVRKGNMALTRAAANLFKPDAEVLAANLYPSDSDKAKLDDILKKAQINPIATLINDPNTDRVGHYLPDHQIALSQTASTATNFINNNRPNNSKQSPLDSPKPLTKDQKASHDRMLTIAQQPLVILDKIKNGTITSQDIQAVSTMYPALFKSMQSKVLDSMLDHLSKGKTISYPMKMSLSLLAGQPLDSTISPQAIMAAQPMPKAMPSTQPASKKGAKSAPALQKMSGMYKTPGQAAEEDKARKE